MIFVCFSNVSSSEYSLSAISFSPVTYRFNKISNTLVYDLSCFDPFVYNKETKLSLEVKLS